MCVLYREFGAPESTRLFTSRWSRRFASNSTHPGGCPSSSSSSPRWPQCENSPRTQTPPSCLRRLGLGRGSRFLRSSPVPLCGVSDSCQEEEKTRKEHSWTDRQKGREERSQREERDTEPSVRMILSPKKEKKKTQNFEVTGFFFFCRRTVNCLCCSVKNKRFVKGAFHHRRRARVR